MVDENSTEGLEDDAGPEESAAGGPTLKKFSIAYTNYLGGHPIREKKHNGGVLRFDAEGVHFRGFHELFVVPWVDVQELAVEGSEEVQRRVTASRLLTIGVFAFAAKKKAPKNAFVTVATKDGEAIFECTRTGPHAIRAKLTGAINWVEGRQRAEAAPAVSTAVPASLADELAKLAKLRDDGILTDAEFDAQKVKLLS